MMKNKMTNEQRIQIIQERLQQAFAPSYLEVIDDSAKHQGHKGAESGAGHFTVILHSTTLLNKDRIAAHREIYFALKDLIPNEIHALKINLK